MAYNTDWSSVGAIAAKGVPYSWSARMQPCASGLCGINRPCAVFPMQALRLVDAIAVERARAAVLTQELLG
eukprot:scaffold150984_cov21-Tisochrysis_lutea.AAC.2